jgi:nitric oxide reductase subunit B
VIEKWRLVSGVFVVLSALLFIYSIFGPAREEKPARLTAPAPSPPQPAE